MSGSKARLYAGKGMDSTWLSSVPGFRASIVSVGVAGSAPVPFLPISARRNDRNMILFTKSL